jgi:hypothetical protein
MVLRKQPRTAGQPDAIQPGEHQISLHIDALVIASFLTILFLLTASRCMAGTGGRNGNDGLTNTAAELKADDRAMPASESEPGIADAGGGSITAAANDAPAFEMNLPPIGADYLASGFLEKDDEPIRPAVLRKCIIFSENLCRAFNDRRVFALASLQTAALVYDGVTTRQFLRRGYVEVDPLARVFLGSRPTWGRMAPLGAVQVIGGMWLAERMATSRHVWVRRFWWLPQIAGIAGNVTATAHNIALR